MPRVGRTLDNGEAGIAAARQRVAEPVEPLNLDALLARGLTLEGIEACSRRRGYKWIEVGLEDLEYVGLIRLRWDQARLDDRVEVLAGRHVGRRMLAALFKPALRQQLELLWDAVHEYGAGTFWCAGFLAACHA